MGIKQFNGTYLVNEDRILFRFNTQIQEEYRLWFTRRVTLFILAATSHLLAKKLEQSYSPGAAKALNEFEKQAILEASKSEQSMAPNFEGGQNYPLGFDPILVLDVTCTLTKNGEKLAQISNLNESEIDPDLSIDFALPGSANLNLKLPPNTLQTMCVLLDQLRLQAGWGEALLQIKNLRTEERNSEVKMSENISIH